MKLGFFLLFLFTVPTVSFEIFDLLGKNCSNSNLRQRESQKSLCSRFSQTSNLAFAAFEETNEECKKTFAREKWGCEAKRTEKGSREAAFVDALASGIVGQKVARECAEGRLEICGCGKGVDPTSGSTAGCSDNFRFGIAFSKKFLAPQSKKNAHLMVKLHNQAAGRRLLHANRVKRCKCHGISGSCQTQTCWWVSPTLSEFSAVLKVKYETASKVTLSPRDELIDSETSQPIIMTQLAFFKPSTDFCDLTRGRECKDDAHCEDICCRRGFRIEHELETEQCKCRFVYCCEVQCETCVRIIEKRVCL
ncbi:hypothetical protein L596_018852 [Steinernema carpocapsae]|uniref:Protein Wnt n=1 Tax=Steinernema carpocapsae TaxID=34508 RepID=A0A4U5N5Y2_STECR|nr:hypothetical protein L596_018852 [Steinernema carpocapsae]